MTTPTKGPRPTKAAPTTNGPRDPWHHFDVTIRRVIGTVDVTPFGDGPPPHVAAFMLIAQADEPGVYEFPMPDEGTCRVTVEYDTPPRPEVV